MSRGFTLIELLVVTSIIVLMTIWIFPNYRAGNEDLNLQISASKLTQNLRKVQEMAVSAKEFQGEVPMGGYGIYFNISDPTRYILFADKDGGKDYDGSGEAVEIFQLEKNTKLSNLSPLGPLTVVFSPPDPVVYFYPDAAVVSITIEAKSQKTVQINKAGLIAIQ